MYGEVFMRRQPCFYLSLIVAMAVVLGCASTELGSSWKDPNFQSPGYHKILVTALADSPTHRRTVEEEFAKQLKARKDKEAISSATLLPNESDLIREKIARVSRVNGFDAVLAIQLLGVDKKIQSVPGTMHYEPTSSYYLGIYDPAYTPGHVVQHEVVILETNLYDVKSERLVWGGTTETFNPSSVEQLVDEMAAVVLESMDKAKVL